MDTLNLVITFLNNSDEWTFDIVEKFINTHFDDKNKNKIYKYILETQIYTREELKKIVKYINTDVLQRFMVELIYNLNDINDKNISLRQNVIKIEVIMLELANRKEQS